MLTITIPKSFAKCAFLNRKRRTHSPRYYYRGAPWIDRFADPVKKNRTIKTDFYDFCHKLNKDPNAALNQGNDNWTARYFKNAPQFRETDSLSVGGQIWHVEFVMTTMSHDVS